MLLYPGQWEPNSLFHFLTAQIPPPLAATPHNEKNTEIQNLAIPQNIDPKLVETASSWIGTGSYILESEGLKAATDDLSSKTIFQDLKVLTLYAAGASISKDQLSLSQEKITKKTAHLNCWQFCLLIYIQNKLISEKLVGELYKVIDKSENKELRVPCAIKSQKYSFLTDSTTPKPGDIICFSHDIGIDWHCAICKEFNQKTKTLTYIHMLGDNVGEDKQSKDYDLITFVKQGDVQSNIINFLNHHKNN